MKFSKRTFPLLLGLLIAVANSNLSSAVATTFKLSMTVRQTPSATDPIVTLYGQIKPVIKAQKVIIEVQIKGKWHGTTLIATTTPSGTWKVEAVATALNAKVNYRAVATIGSKRIYSLARSVT